MTPDRTCSVVPAQRSTIVPRPRISVSVITYNHAAYIAQALDSALAQRTTFDYEIVIADDCSNDGTREIVARYGRRYPDRIRVLLPDRHRGFVRNALRLSHAWRGEYVAMLDGDDYWIDTRKLQLQADLLEAHPDAFVCGARAYIWKDGEPQPSGVSPDQPSEVLATYGARELVDGKWWFRTSTRCSVDGCCRAFRGTVSGIGPRVSG